METEPVVQIQEPVLKQEPKLSLPIAILLAGGLIAMGAYMGLSRGAGVAPQPQAAEAPTGNLDAMKAVSATDHIRGNPNALVKIVEYSDTECPFCKRFHETMKEIMATYGKEGKVAWVYRSFPIDQLHPRARAEAVALECAAALGGNDKFWEFTDKVYEITPSNNGLDPAELPKIAANIGLDTAAFAACQTSKKYDALLEANIQEAAATGGNGTPWSIVVAPSGKKYPLSGAQPIESLKQLIEVALKSK